MKQQKSFVVYYNSLGVLEKSKVCIIPKTKKYIDLVQFGWVLDQNQAFLFKGLLEREI